MAKYRILSLDGGGIRGLLTTVLLERLVGEAPGWLEKTDLIAGTSTGGIIAIGLAFGLSTSSLRQMYYEKGPLIFHDTLLDDLLDLGGWVGAEYSNTNLRKLVTDILGDTRLEDLETKVLIPTFDLDNQKPNPQNRSWAPKFFHNFSGPDSDGDRKAADVALYTTAAPTFFPSVDGYIDGGVAANNPSMAALAQTQDTRAYIENRPTLDEIVLLSIGTGITHHRIEERMLDWGKWQWVRPLIDIMVDGVMGIADFQCRQMLRNRYHRIAPFLPPEQSIDLDEWQKRDILVEIGQHFDLQKTTQWIDKHWR